MSERADREGATPPKCGSPGSRTQPTREVHACRDCGGEAREYSDKGTPFFWCVGCNRGVRVRAGCACPSCLFWLGADEHRAAAAVVPAFGLAGSYVEVAEKALADGRDAPAMLRAVCRLADIQAEMIRLYRSRVTPVQGAWVCAVRNDCPPGYEDYDPLP